MKIITDIVIIDDDDISCFLYSELLKGMQLSHYVHCITDSTKAETYLEKLCPKGALSSINKCILILLDRNMPILDGFELLEQLKRNSTIDHDKIHVVMLTSILTDRERKKASRYNLINMYEKPLTREILQESIAYLEKGCIKVGVGTKREKTQATG